MAMSFWQRIAFYQKHGWCPLPTSRHPKEVRDSLREARIRPQMKQCYRNSQRFIVESDLAPRLTYVEGVVDGHIPHAWLLLDGQILDLTLEKPVDEYSPRLTATAEEVAKHLCANDFFACEMMVVQ